MTGGGRGFCMLRLPSRTGERLTGMAGLAGWRVGVPAVLDEPARLLGRMRQIESNLRQLRLRLRRLQGNRKDMMTV